jgi:hypothetical protein
MAKLDRLGWAEATGGTFFGVRLGVRVSAAGALAEAAGRLPPGPAPAGRPRVARLYSWVVGGAGSRPGMRRMHLVYADASLVARTPAREEALAALESDARLYVAEHAPRRVFVHAGVVGWRGRAVLVPGRSHSGKSRLVEAFVRAGATYYSDEYAVLDGAGRVHAFPASLSIRGDGAAPAYRISAAELTGGAAVPPLPVGLVAAVSYSATGPGRWRTVSAGEGALAVLAHSLPARRRPSAALRTLVRALRESRVVVGRRGEADEAAQRLLGDAIWNGRGPER